MFPVSRASRCIATNNDTWVFQSPVLPCRLPARIQRGRFPQDSTRAANGSHNPCAQEVNSIRSHYGTRTLVVLLFCVTLTAAMHAQLIVDCTRSDPNAYPSINAALPNAGPGSSIIVTGPCNENVTLYGANGINLGAWWGQTAAINGSLSIINSTGIYLYGLNVTNPAGNGFSVQSSKGIVLDTCTSNGNAGTGLNASLMSDVTVTASGSFDKNANGGISVNQNSLVSLVAWAGLIDISNNSWLGVFVDQSSFWTLGHTTIANNTGSSGLGISMLGSARAQIGALFGPNVIQGNSAGGASIGEGSEISFSSIGQPNVIQSNGPIGVSVNLG